MSMIKEVAFVAIAVSDAERARKFYQETLELKPSTTAMGGNLIAQAIFEGDQTWRQFTPFELVWAGGVFGRAAAQTRVWVKRLRDAIEERRARAREAAHRLARDESWPA